VRDRRRWNSDTYQSQATGRRCFLWRAISGGPLSESLDGTKDPLALLISGRFVFLDFFSILFGRKGLGRGLLWRSRSGLSPGDETAALLPASTAGASRPLRLRIELEADFFDTIAALALPTRQTQYIITKTKTEHLLRARSPP
jgi:hypothetical protein